MTKRLCLLLMMGGLVVASTATPARASGHGPVFGAATPTLGRGGWSIDQAYTIRLGDQVTSDQMFKTMVSFGITEIVQASVSVPLAMSTGGLADARMMSAMSNDRDVEALVAYRFQRKPIGVGGRRESTLYAGGSVPTESSRDGVDTASSFVVGASTGYASRIHYVWLGGAYQHFASRADSALLTFVYGYRPPVFRREAGKPDLRFFVEATAEDRADQRTVFAGPTTLLVYKAIALEGGVLFPLAQRLDTGTARERVRVAVNFSYFFWLK